MVLPTSRSSVAGELEWEPVDLLGRDGRPFKARVAAAPDGSWYVMWRDRDSGWTVGHSPARDELTSPRPTVEGLELAGDAQLVAEAWAAGRGAVLLAHDYDNVDTRDDDEGGWVADAWSCDCGAGEFDFDNIGEARAAARAHWRTAVRAAMKK